MSSSSSSSSPLTKQNIFVSSHPYMILRDLGHPVFTSSDFSTVVFFLQSKVISLVSKPQPGGPGDRVAQLTSGALGSRFVAFCYSQGYGEQKHPSQYTSENNAL
jgi:hypothetical protein